MAGGGVKPLGLAQKIRSDGSESPDLAAGDLADFPGRCQEEMAFGRNAAKLARDAAFAVDLGGDLLMEPREPRLKFRQQGSKALAFQKRKKLG